MAATAIRANLAKKSAKANTNGDAAQFQYHEGDEDPRRQGGRVAEHVDHHRPWACKRQDLLNAPNVSLRDPSMSSAATTTSERLE